MINLLRKTKMFDKTNETVKKIYELLDTPNMMLEQKTIKVWNNLEQKQRSKVLENLLYRIKRHGIKRVENTHFCNCIIDMVPESFNLL